MIRKIMAVYKCLQERGELRQSAARGRGEEEQLRRGGGRGGLAAGAGPHQQPAGPAGADREAHPGRAAG